MKRSVTAVCALGLLTAWAGPARASGFFDAGCCLPTVCISYVEQVVTCYRPELREQTVPYTIQVPYYRTQTVDYNYTVVVPQWREVTQVATYWKYVPREVSYDVPCWQLVPVPVTDPCTGCVWTVNCPKLTTQRVRSVVYDCVPQQQQYRVPVCTYKTEVRRGQTQQLVCEWRTQNVQQKYYYYVPVPYQVKVTVPVYAPACY